MKTAIIALIIALFISESVCLRKKPGKRKPASQRDLAAIDKKVEKLWTAINELKQERSGVHIHFHDAAFDSSLPHDVHPIPLPNGELEAEEVLDDIGPIPDIPPDDDHEEGHHGHHNHRHGHRTLHYHNAAEVNVRMNLHTDDPRDLEHDHDDHGDVHAHCEVMANKHKMPEGFTNRLMGPIHLYQAANNDTIHVAVNVTGCPSNTKHGFHVHEYGDMVECCNSLGSHYNPTGHDHGSPQDDERHEGDFGNVICEDGKIETAIKVKGHLKDMIGRSIVLHQREDDMGKGENEASKASGDAGGRVACCVIGLANPEKHSHHEHEKHEHHSHDENHHHDHHEDIFDGLGDVHDHHDEHGHGDHSHSEDDFLSMDHIHDF